MKSGVVDVFKYKAYRNFWICAFISNLGTWTQDVASSWVMTHLTMSTFVVALLPFASSLPLVLLSIPAGFMSDSGDRRRILLFAQTLMFAAAVILGIEVWRGDISPTYLLLLSFALGVGSALNGPAFQTVLSDLVPAEQQQNSVLLFYMGINISRVLGPALGGGILSFFGAGTAYWWNAVSFLGLVIFFWKWPLPHKKDKAHPQEQIAKIDEHDWKFLFSMHNMKLWIEIFLVSFCASCLWALYPAKGRIELQLSTWQFGSLLGFLGLGACFSVAFTEKLMDLGKTALSLSRSYLLYAIGLLCMAFGKSYGVICVGMFLGGMGWLVLATLMNMSSRQQTGHSHLKATMLGVFLSVFYLGMSMGSLVWGAVAQLEGLQSAFSQAALCLALIGLYKVRGIRKLSGRGAESVSSAHSR